MKNLQIQHLSSYTEGGVLLASCLTNYLKGLSFDDWSQAEEPKADDLVFVANLIKHITIVNYDVRVVLTTFLPILRP